MKTIAKIKANDNEHGAIIDISIDNKNNVILSNSEDAGIGENQTEDQAIEAVYLSWGQWATFEWLDE